MSPSSSVDHKQQDELDVEVDGSHPTGVHDLSGTSATTEPATPKRGRGRPKGSKNRKTVNPESLSGPSTPTVPKKRGRPRKEKNDDEPGSDGPPVKRKRGRPPKPKPEVDSEDAEPAPKKRRGRPPKSATPAT